MRKTISGTKRIVRRNERKRRMRNAGLSFPFYRMVIFTNMIYTRNRECINVPS